jgi:hypothetical protein
MLLRNAVPLMCEKHGIKLAYVKTLAAGLGNDAAYCLHFQATVEIRPVTNQLTNLSGFRAGD